MNTRILSVRKNAGLTQQAFADRIGVKRNTVAVYESGGCNVSDSVIKNICNEFSVNEKWLRTGEGDMYIPIEDETAAVVASLLDNNNPLFDLIVTVVREYNKLDDKSKLVINHFIDTLIAQQEYKNQDHVYASYHASASANTGIGYLPGMFDNPEAETESETETEPHYFES